MQFFEYGVQNLYDSLSAVAQLVGAIVIIGYNLRETFKDQPRTLKRAFKCVSFGVATVLFLNFCYLTLAGYKTMEYELETTNIASAIRRANDIEIGYYRNPEPPDSLRLAQVYDPSGPSFRRIMRSVRNLLDKGFRYTEDAQYALHNLKIEYIRGDSASVSTVEHWNLPLVNAKTGEVIRSGMDAFLPLAQYYFLRRDSSGRWLVVDNPVPTKY